MSNKNVDRSGGVQSVDRALTVLSLLTTHEMLGVTDIAEALGVHKSTAFRLVATLESHELVEQVSERGKFRLGVGVLRLAGAAAVRLDVVQESRRITSELAARVGETVNIVVLSGRDALYVDQVAGPSALRLHNWVGQRIPLHATSNGKVLLAHASPAFVEDLLAQPLQGFTDRTVTEPGALRDQLAEVLTRGWAVAVDELEVGLSAVAAPLVGASGAVVASISVSGPTFRLPRARLAEVAEAVCASADRISSRLGWHGAGRQSGSNAGSGTRSGSNVTIAGQPGRIA